MRILLGEIPENTYEPQVKVFQTIQGIPPLNDSQVNAIRFALMQRFSLIQGPPGTGKTTTIVGLAYAIHHQQRSKILITAPSNAAASRITEALGMANLNVVRYLSDARQELDYLPDDAVSQYYVHRIAVCLDIPDSKRLNELEVKKSDGQLIEDESTEYRKLREKVYKDICKNADIVCSTCNSSGSNILVDIKFDVLIVDEATQAVEPDILIALMHDVKKVVLVGDHCQLGPAILSPQASRLGYSISLMQRLVQIGMIPEMLQTQYRMHPALSEFPCTLR